jgi:glycosyltransferase involved in cell wall biosynthesis
MGTFPFVTPSLFDLILPCYNPLPGWADNVLASIASLQQALPGAEPHVVLVNDGSQRGVEEKDIARLRTELPHFTYVTYSQNQGKGYALRQGVLHARHKLCVFTDIDFPYEETSMATLCQELSTSGADIVAGVRDEGYYAAVPPARVAISRSLRFLTQLLLRLPVSDTQCGLKGFNERGKALFLRSQTKRYLFDLEFLYLAARQQGLRVRAVPVHLKPGVVFSRMSPQVLFREGRSFAKLLLGGMR